MIELPALRAPAASAAAALLVGLLAARGRGWAETPPNGAGDDHCDFVTVRLEEAADVLRDHITRNTPLRIVGLGDAARYALTDQALSAAVGEQVVPLRQLSYGRGHVSKAAVKRNATLSKLLAGMPGGGELAAGWYAAQVSVPQHLPGLAKLLQGVSPVGIGNHASNGSLGGTWRKAAGPAIEAGPYMYYYGGAVPGDGGPGLGPSLYLHYDAAENFAHVVDGWKEYQLYDPFTASSVLYGSNIHHANGSPIDVDDPNVTSKYPLFRFAVPRRCVVRAGEALYLPLFWWHWVRTGPVRTVAITHFHRGDKEKKGFLQKIMCGYSLKPAAFECA